MKYLIALMFAFSSVAFAEDVAPAYLKDAVITVTLTNGKVYTYSANEYKVVRRGTSVKPVVAETTPAPRTEAEPEYQHRLNRISLHAGVGFSGQTVTNSANEVDVKENKRAVGGVQLQHRFDGTRWSGSGILTTNKTGLVGVGYDF